jgi:membrane-bound serine protease (ClpP class)
VSGLPLRSRAARSGKVDIAFAAGAIRAILIGMRPLPPAVLAGLFCAACVSSASSRVSLIRIEGAIGPAASGYIARAARVAGETGSQCLIVELDTPGGLLDTTKAIVQSFYASPVPVVVYVAPAGANAGSAGCFITLAADVAAMAPNTSIGAAHPVALGLGSEQQADDTMAKKLENFAVSTIEAIAEKRGRNVEWARSAVRESASITAERALELKVIDLLSPDRADLLRQLDGRDVRGTSLATADAAVEEIPMLLRERVFQAVWRPEVMFILMLIAIYGIIGELSNPGAIFPGVVGAIALILALYMGAVLPVNVAGIALIVLALALFVIDAIAPTHGVLTIGGIVSFFLGGMMLFDSVAPVFRLSLAMIIPASLLTAAFFVFVVGAGLRAQFLPVKVGRENLVGRTATALTDIDATSGRVLFDGEDWRATSVVPVAKGETVIVTAIDGLSFTVQPRRPEVPP